MHHKRLIRARLFILLFVPRPQKAMRRTWNFVDVNLQVIILSLQLWADTYAREFNQSHS